MNMNAFCTCFHVLVLQQVVQNIYRWFARSEHVHDEVCGTARDGHIGTLWICTSHLGQQKVQAGVNHIQRRPESHGKITTNDFPRGTLAHRIEMATKNLISCEAKRTNICFIFSRFRLVTAMICSMRPGTTTEWQEEMVTSQYRMERRVRGTYEWWSGKRDTPDTSGI